MSDYSYEVIKTCVVEWYEKILFKLEPGEGAILSNNGDNILVIDFDFPNCIAQLSVTNSPFEPYQFVFFEAMDIGISHLEETKLIYCFYDNDTMEKTDVIDALDEAFIFCSNYKVK